MVYCGHLLERQGVRPDPRKVDAICQMPPPTDRKGVMRLLGMATYLAKFCLAKFCPQFSDVTEPIRSLLHHNNEFIWNKNTHGATFDKLKQLIVES